MASAAQLEAFSWWLSQSPENRRNRDLREKFGIAENTASKWLAVFNAELARVATESTRVQLQQFRAEYDALQSRTMAALPIALDALEHNLGIIKESKQKGELVDPDLVGKTVKDLKSVYSLAEAASGADVAKRRASQAASDGKGDALTLPDFSSLFHLGAEVDSNLEAPAIEAEAVTIPENPNEIRIEDAASEEK